MAASTKVSTRPAAAGSILGPFPPQVYEMGYDEMYRRSIEQPEAFWAEQAGAIDWHVPPQRILDDSNPPFRRWFVGGMTNLCHNAIDRHLEARGDQLALVGWSSETGSVRELSYLELHREVNTFAASLQALGVDTGDRVVIYMPHTVDAVITMLACARIGAIHSVVFGGFAAHNLAVRIDDARPVVLVTADAGIRGGKVIPFMPLVDEALARAQHPPDKVLVIDRGLAGPLPLQEGRDIDYAALRAQHADAQVPVVWLESNAPSYILYTSGTTGTPKGVQRDVGGYAVALALSMWSVYDIRPGQVIFSTSDIGWVVGHSYNVYGPLIAGATSIIYEGLPTAPDAGIWWRLVEQYGVRTMFSSPTALRVLKKHDPSHITGRDLSKFEHLFLAGEPLDEPTARWISEVLGKPVIDNYWQTETGWPVLTLMPGLEMKPVRLGSPGLPNLGFRLRVIDETTGADAGPGEKGVLAIQPPLPPGCMTTVWGNDQRCIDSYYSHFRELLYSSLDWAIRDADGYTFILGRTDDVINVAGHRLGTREIEESVSSHPQVAEAAVIGVQDALKGQVPIVFATLRQRPDSDEGASETAAQMQQVVVAQLGGVARPARIYLVNALPKTRSGKLLRRSLQALAEQRDPGDLSTLDDPNALEEIRQALARGPEAGS